ncbi:MULTISPECIES: FAD-dependent monooxygenase [Actinomycetes]|uniref:FAD-dependent monooxygenase n=1 Tax=Actinomycetes TaxID=1760 RepID=UPI00068D6361|nr:MULTISPECIES: FAD-dependent monooxygenase [Actinomycetes]
MSFSEPSQSSGPFRVACIGGGPGGLFAAIALARQMPNAQVDVFERNRASDVFGFGVVFSDATLDNIERIDSVLTDALATDGRHWDSIEVRSDGTTVAAGGNGMSAIHRKVLLGALHQRATDLGVRLHFNHPITVDDLDAAGEHDLIIAADGANSSVRQRFIDDLGHAVDEARVKFIWFGTTYDFAGLTFLHERSEHGNFAVHAYPIGSGLSTFIVETDEDTWRSAGLDEFDTSQPPGVSDTKSQRYLETLFADYIDGHKLVANNSRWANFRTRRTRQWATRGAHSTPVVLIGDAVHTAHFSVGSGTKMAMEDAAELARSIANTDDLDTALNDFQSLRRPQVARIQDSSLPSLSWWDHFGEYQRTLDPWQFGFHFFTRALSAEKIKVRDPGFIDSSFGAWIERHGADPLHTPLAVGSRRLTSRLLSVTETTQDAMILSDGNATLRAESQLGTDNIVLWEAPMSETTSLPDAERQRLAELSGAAPTAVVVRGGTALTRVLCAEYLRLTHHIPVIIVEHPSALKSRRAVNEEDDASTLILSGRADAVAFEPRQRAATGTRTHAEATR